MHNLYIHIFIHVYTCTCICIIHAYTCIKCIHIFLLCAAITCSLTLDLDNGEVTYSKVDPDNTPPSSVPLGTVAIHVCTNPLYTIVGSNSRVCDVGDGTSTIGEWSGEDIMCTGTCI